MSFKIVKGTLYCGLLHKTHSKLLMGFKCDNPEYRMGFIPSLPCLHICHSCCVWTRVLWQVAHQRSDGDRLVAAGLGQLVMGVTFIPLFYGRAPLVATERAVLALFCTPTS